MAEKFNYYGLPGTDKVCPILSIAQIRFDGMVIECIGDKCQWYERCYKNIEYDSEPWPEDWDILD